MLPFAVTIFLSATLLFLVQPMMGKMLLPLAGGSSAVWNTCMVTFQAGLLAGYLYSHLVTKKLALKHQVILHGVLSLIAFGLSFSEAPSQPPPSNTTLSLNFWLIGAIVTTVGLPFFVVSTTGPLIQSWFSRTSHPRANDPYFLYAASNIGSSIGLLGYPLLLESNTNIPLQRVIWAGLFLVLAVMLVVCGVLAIRGEDEARMFSTSPEAPPAAAEAITWRRRLLWIVLAAAPSSLMLGVTQHISTDLAAVPLLWVIPLFLYLMTFTVAFSPRLPMSAGLLGWILVPLALADGLIIMLGFSNPNYLFAILALHIGTFTIAALMCHRRLADDRPSTSRLTEFYFFIALGGVLGGIFNALLAPVLFTLVYEYPITIALCLLLRPWSPRGRASTAARVGLDGRMGVAAAFVAAGVLLLALYAITPALRAAGVEEIHIDTSRSMVTLAICAMLVVLVRRPLVSALPFLAIVLAGQYMAKIGGVGENLAIRRSFFGVHHVHSIVPRRDGAVVDDAPTIRMLNHGTTLHGIQLLGKLARQRPDGTKYMIDAAGFPTTYYHAKGPVGDIMRYVGNNGARSVVEPATAGVIEAARAGVVADAAGSPFPALGVGSLAAWPAFAQSLSDSARSRSPLANVAIVGLGTGGLAAWSKPGDHYTFYEIDPVVKEIATDPSLFTFISDARARGVTVDIELGDGRIAIGNAPAESYGVIMLDAFSSDSIPVHLLTRQALEIYLSKLRSDGVVCFHISNRYFNLAPVLARHALTLHLPAVVYRNPQSLPDSSPRGFTNARFASERMDRSIWVVFAKNPSVLAGFAADTGWWDPVTIELAEQGPDWNDDFADILSIFKGWKR